jgi:hypothetical protein
MNADADALADSSSIAKVFSLKAGTDFVSKNVGLMNPTILRKLKSLVRHGSEKTDDGYR